MALAAARRAGDRRRANAVLAGAPVAALWGPGPVTRASGRCLDVVRVLRITQGAPAVEAVALRCQAVLETLRGRAEAARRMIASSRRMVEELGITQRVLEADLFAGLIELLEGDAPAGERWLRTAYDGLRAQGLGIDAAQAAALLGRALLAQGRVAEAEAISRESESLAGDSFKAAIAWRGVRAEALAARGEHAAAIEFARAAVEIAAATDDLLDHADARQALAIALRAAGRAAEADAEARRAAELWEAKGATLLAERARRQELRAPGPERAGAAERIVPTHSEHRRVRKNAATGNAARLEAVIAARDVVALEGVFADPFSMEDHQTGVAYDLSGELDTWRKVMRVRDLKYQQEPLATLGDSLALVRHGHSGVSGGRLDAGAFEWEAINLVEVDDGGRRQRVELFSIHHLEDAILRLYERYA
jgi:tetratricopeptide (TPR) repeat protein